MQPIYPEAVTASCASLLNNFTPVGLNNVSAPAQVCQLLPKPEADWLLVLRLFRLLGPVRIYLHLLVLCKWIDTGNIVRGALLVVIPGLQVETKG